MLRRLHAAQLQGEDEVEVGAPRLLVDRTRVEADRPGLAPAVGHVGCTDGVDVDDREGSEEDLSGDGRVSYYLHVIYKCFCHLICSHLFTFF